MTVHPNRCSPGGGAFRQGGESIKRVTDVARLAFWVCGALWAICGISGRLPGLSAAYGALAILAGMVLDGVAVMQKTGRDKNSPSAED